MAGLLDIPQEEAMSMSLLGNLFDNMARYGKRNAQMESPLLAAERVNQMYEAGQQNAMRNKLLQMQLDQMQGEQDRKKKEEDAWLQFGGQQEEAMGIMGPMAPGRNTMSLMGSAVQIPAMREQIAKNMFPSSTDNPASVREWEYFQSLSPEQRQQYLVMKRAEQWKDLGNQVVLPTPGVPGSVSAVLPKGLPPQDLPEVRGAQAEAQQAANLKYAGPIAASTATQKMAAENNTKTELGSRKALSLIQSAENILDEATGSIPGTLVDMAAGAFGKSTKGAQATARLKTIEGGLMLAMPRMEGPQSDRDTALYRQMAAQISDSTIPVETRKSALYEIKRLHQKYVGGGQPESNVDGLVNKYLNGGK